MWFVSALLGIGEEVSQRRTISEATAIATLWRSGQVGSVEGLLIPDVAFGKWALSFTNMLIKLYIYFYVYSTFAGRCSLVLVKICLMEDVRMSLTSFLNFIIPCDLLFSWAIQFITTRKLQFLVIINHFFSKQVQYF